MIRMIIKIGKEHGNYCSIGIIVIGLVIMAIN